MSRLYIIGNGFDIAHGIPCKYSDFRRYCEEKMPKMYEKLNRFYDGGDKLWSDLNVNCRISIKMLYLIGRRQIIQIGIKIGKRTMTL